MRVPLSWLREFVPVAEDASAEDLMATLVKVGLEEEDVHRPTDEMSGPIVVGQVLSMEPETHSNGKTVNWCQVRVVPEGQEQTLTGKGIEPSGVQGIICGAHNFKPGDKVVVTLPGAVLPGGFAITARKTYGHKSAGMIASTRALGIGDPGPGSGAWHRCDGAAGPVRPGGRGERDPGPRLRILPARYRPRMVPRYRNPLRGLRARLR